MRVCLQTQMARKGGFGLRREGCLAALLTLAERQVCSQCTPVKYPGVEARCRGAKKLHGLVLDGFVFGQGLDTRW